MFGPEGLAIACGLGSAIVWGAGDFSGGYACRKHQVPRVILYSQIIGALTLIGLQFFFAERIPSAAHLAWGGIAGVFGLLGLAALYRGLAIGHMGIVAPVSAVVTAIIPIGVALFTEGLPKTTQFIGFLCALAAVWLLSTGHFRKENIRAELSLAVLAGVGFSLFFICIDRVSNEVILWPLISARAVSITLLAFFLSYKHQLIPAPRGHFSLILACGIFDAAGNAFFALASQLGRLDVAVILASMYPVSTVLLARGILKEPLNTQQGIGLVLACATLTLIAV